jgi:hypothetical protein
MIPPACVHENACALPEAVLLFPTTWPLLFTAYALAPTPPRLPRLDMPVAVVHENAGLADDLACVGDELRDAKAEVDHTARLRPRERVLNAGRIAVAHELAGAAHASYTHRSVKDAEIHRGRRWRPGCSRACRHRADRGRCRHDQEPAQELDACHFEAFRSPPQREDRASLVLTSLMLHSAPRVCHPGGTRRAIAQSPNLLPCEDRDRLWTTEGPGGSRHVWRDC